MASEAIDAHCGLLAEKGLDIPAPRPLSEYQAAPDLAGVVWVVLDVDRESLALSTSPEFLRILQAAREEIAKGEILSLEEMKRELL